MNKEEKAKLWADRIQQYKTSGQTCKQWCAENDIPLSTMGYWQGGNERMDEVKYKKEICIFRYGQKQKVNDCYSGCSWYILVSKKSVL
mgnify:CR=1 FL=1